MFSTIVASQLCAKLEMLQLEGNVEDYAMILSRVSYDFLSISVS